ncbi:MAG TPA: GGDEF domain-containing protein [Thermoanaerobaculia bacterium]|nr:GGDEF domain-containing protein [Thermoanaerobaculia bacterium]
MKRHRPPRDLWASLLPIAGAALALLVAYDFPGLVERPIPAGLLVLFLFAGAAGACHRPAVGSTTLSLGAAILPPALFLTGAAPAALLAGSALLVSELSLRLVRRFAAREPAERRGFFPRSFENTGRAILSTLAAGGVWTWLAAYWTPVPALATATVAYLAVWTGLDVADRKIHRPDQPLRLAGILFPLGVDAAGWVAGGVLALTGRAAGWRLGGYLLAAFALLALEAFRNALLRDKAQSRARDLERLRRASQRMITPAQEMEAIADRIRIECAKVLPFHWFQFETLAPGSELRSWWWGPLSEGLAEGVPEPDRYAPPLPGVHRRTTWQILERQMRSRPDGTMLGRLRLWCDPRLIEPREVELLDRLLPQMTASVQRCLLDREAREDPLTGAVMRRVLEKRLHEVHARAYEKGESMAVVLCDLDHFKRINDTFGHPAGDAALIAVAGILKGMCRASDLCCRYGGEEFLLLLDQTGGDDALAIAERLRRSIEELAFEYEGQQIPLALSAGVASFPDLYIKTGAELILFADEALYEAKRRGRNRCLLDLGQGRYLDTEGNTLSTEDVKEAAEAPRIFV